MDSDNVVIVIVVVFVAFIIALVVILRDLVLIYQKNHVHKDSALHQAKDREEHGQRK